MIRLVLWLCLAYASSLWADGVEIPPGGRVEIEVHYTDLIIEGHDGSEFMVSHSNDVAWKLRGVVLWIEVADSSEVVTLRVPRTSAVSVDGHAGSVTIRDVAAPVVVRTDGGDMEITRVEGTVRAETRDGQMVIESVTGAVEADSQHQPIVIRGVQGNIRARSVTNAVTVIDCVAKVFDVSTVTGIIEFRGLLSADASHDFSTHTGEIRFYPDPSSDATIIIGGNVDGAMARGAPLRRVDRKRAEVMLGEGRGRVEATAIIGAVRVLVEQP